MLKRLLPCMMVLCLGALTGWAGEPGRPEKSVEMRFLLVSDRSQKNSVSVTANLRRAMSDASLAAEELDISKLPGLTRARMTYSAIIFAAEKAAQFVYPDDVKGYVLDGGTLVVAMPTWNDELMNQFGLGLSGPEKAFFIGKGFRTIRHPLAGVPITYPKDFGGGAGIRMVASPSWEVCMEYLEPAGMPMLVQRSFGNGRIVYWNVDTLNRKQFRGFFLFSLLKNLPIGAMSIFNALLFQIDDSPPPVTNRLVDPVARDYGLTDVRFYKHKWYETVENSLASHAIKVGHFVCINYLGKVTRPFTGDSDRPEFLRETLDHIQARKEEIGFHGLNHQSLSLSEVWSTAWPSFEDMREGTEAGMGAWEALRLPAPFTYVPPNNVIDAAGKKALVAGFPSIRAIFRVYQGGDEEKFEGDLGDEFGQDPDVPALFNAPRFSDGYHRDEADVFKIVAGVMSHGLVNHFIHPDDVFDPERSKRRSWEQLMVSLDQILDLFDRLLPGAHRLSPKSFITPLKDFINTKVTMLSENNGLRIFREGRGRNCYFLFARDASGTPKIEGGKVLSTYEGDGLYIIEATASSCFILPGVLPH